MDTMEKEDYVVVLINESNPFRYAAALFNTAIWNLSSYLFFQSGKNVESPSLRCYSTETHYFACWHAILSILFLKLLIFLEKPCTFAGHCILSALNYFLINDGIFDTLRKAIFDRASLQSPPLDHFYSICSFLDIRQELQTEHMEQSTESTNKESHLSASHYAITGNSTWKNAANLCVMAAKLAYENKHVTERIVRDRWKMHFVKSYDCWNEYLHRVANCAFILTDRPQNANVVVLAFRGTALFDVYDWCTDFDFSWCDLPPIGRVHVGFLEALGLASRSTVETFKNIQRNASMKAERKYPASSPTSGLPPCIIDDCTKVLAYDTISVDLRSLLRANRGAKLFITGHSLGGALSVLFVAMQILERDYLCLSKLEALFTFGQPRVADTDFAAFMERNLCRPERNRYFRVVYGDDLVPRIPFDNRLFLFKHFGSCHYYPNMHELKIVQEEPHKNLSLIFDPSRYLNAMRELVEMIHLHFSEGKKHHAHWFCIFTRLVGVVLPAAAGHNPANYVNAIKYGPSPLKLEAKEDTRKQPDSHSYFAYGVSSLFLCISIYLSIYLSKYF